MKRGALVQLKCAIQHYDWGVSGQTPSAVAELGSLNREEKIDEEKPHAELWMGTHLSGLNVIKETDSSDSSSSSSSLKQHVEANAKETLGEKCLKRFGNDLPFLLKVLSVAKALSIQAHPDKQLAEKLHEEKPHMYKDANHKPEMALAVTEFEAMSGFISEPKEALEKCPELKLLTGIRLEEMDAMKEDKKAQMKYLFTKVMLAEKEEVAKHVRALVKRLKEEAEGKGGNGDDERDRLALRLNGQYPDDVGVMCAYLLNYIKLQPGEAVYMAANEPHAYLDGECVEVMATSDNVVRAGLTPKARDTEILCDMLTYKLGKPEVLTGDVIDKNTKRYSPPFDEFELEVISCSKNETAELTVSQGPSILLVKNGKGTLNDDVRIEKGSVVFANANEKMTLTNSDDGEVSIYRAQVNTRVF
jgi:mannose-6-phosphate isomerase